MNASVRYALTTLGVILAAVLALWPLLSPDGRQGVLVAAVVAWPVQVLAFAALVRFRDRLNAFLAAWLGGTVLRLLIVAGVAWFAVRRDGAEAVPMLLALAAFFFGLLLLEPVYFRPGTRSTAT